MRILQLGPYPPPSGGVQVHLVAIQRFLRSRQVPCTVVNITRSANTKAPDVFYPKTALGVLWELLRHRYEIAHLHVGGAVTFRLLALGWICCAIPGMRAVFTLHSGGYASSPAGRARFRTMLAGLVLRRFDCLIGVNPEIVALFRRLGARQDRVRLICPYGGVASAADEGASADDGMPEALGSFLAAHGPVLITVGLLEPEYDLMLQVEAIGPLRKIFPRLGLAIIGAGSLFDSLTTFARATPFADHVLVCGDVPHAATLGAIARSDLLLRTTHYDGDSIAVREALALGTPVVATDNGMRPAGVRLIPVGDLSALCRAVEECLAGPSRRRAAFGRPDQANLQALWRVYRELGAARASSAKWWPARP